MGPKRRSRRPPERGLEIREVIIGKRTGHMREGYRRCNFSTIEADVCGGMDDDALALRIMELLNDDAVVSKLKNALYPHPLSDISWTNKLPR